MQPQAWIYLQKANMLSCFCAETQEDTGFISLFQMQFLPLFVNLSNNRLILL